MNERGFEMFSGKPGKPRSASVLSLRRALEANGFTCSLAAMNTFARRPMLMQQVPRPDRQMNGDFTPRPLRDSDITALTEFLEHQGFRSLKPSLVRDVVMLMADDNSFSPPADLVASFVWDGKERLDNFFLDYAGVQPGSELQRAYVRQVTRCFFIAIVARIFRPGCKVDTMPVLEGPQGSRKSSLLRAIALRDEWFSDSMPHDLANKDARSHLAGNLVIELAEVAQLKRSGLDAMKAFITCQHDKYRPSFGRFDIDWPRQSVFVGSTNSDDYLADPTGNRRFWPLKTTTIHVEEAASVMEQVYAEARAAFETGEDWWLSEETEQTAREEQATRTEYDPWHDFIADMIRTENAELDGWVKMSITKILTALEIPKDRRTRAHQMRISASFVQLGGERHQTGGRGNRRWEYWFRPPEK